MSRFQILIPIVLFFLGIIWCREMFPRWHEDWEIITGNTGDSADRAVTGGLWILTGIILLVMTLMLAYFAGTIHQSMNV